MNIALRILPETLAVCRLEAHSPIPDWAIQGGFFNVTRTAEELSLVVAEAAIPPNTPDLIVESGWRAFMVIGPLDFGLTGILSAIACPLAAATIPIFALSTYDTDYILVKQSRLDEASDTLRGAGFTVETVG